MRFHAVVCLVVDHCTYNVVEVVEVTYLFKLDVGLVHVTIFPTILVF